MTTRCIQGYGGDKLQIKEFKLEDIADNASIMMIAKRGSGKSWVCRELMLNYKKMSAGIVIAPTDKLNGFYKQFFSDVFVHNKYKSSIFEKLLFRQMKILEKKKQHPNLKPEIFVVMDDCLSSKKTWIKDGPIMEVLYNGRHYKITYILTMQYPLGISPDLRSQFEYIFLLKDDIHSNLKKIYEHYAGIFPTYDSFHQVYTQLTADHGCMVIVNTERHKKPIEGTSFLDKIFWFKANNIENLPNIGCEQFIKYHEKNYDPNWEKKEFQFDVNQFCMEQKKNKGVIKIEKIKE